METKPNQPTQEEEQYLDPLQESVTIETAEGVKVQLNSTVYPVNQLIGLALKLKDKLKKNNGKTPASYT